jgi:predicted nucleic acid-binding protein
MSVVFDTEALLAFYLGEPGGRMVQRRLEEIMEGETKGYLNIVNLTELYYILYRKSPDIAQEKERNLRGYGLEVVPINDDGLWKKAAETKGSHALSLADAFAAATAKVKKATLMAGRDTVFDGIDIQIEGINRKQT